MSQRLSKKEEKVLDNLKCPVTNKKRHKNRKLALTAASAGYAHHSITLYIYKCSHCKDYHLTRSLARVPQNDKD